MKLAIFAALVASASAFAPQADVRVSTELGASRRDVMNAAAAAAAAFVPVAANAAAGESPRFSVFGVIGDGSSYSEGAAYGSDQSTKTYSPYSVYGNEGDKASLYDPNTPEFAARKKAFVAETGNRLAKLPAYIEKKQWFNVNDELTRYMYDTRFAVKGLATTKEQKKAAKAFLTAIESTSLYSRQKKQDACMAAAKDSAAKLDAFAALL